jgi:hypothetical protein
MIGDRHVMLYETMDDSRSFEKERVPNTGITGSDKRDILGRSTRGMNPWQSRAGLIGQHPRGLVPSHLRTASNPPFSQLNDI